MAQRILRTCTVVAAVLAVGLVWAGSAQAQVTSAESGYFANGAPPASMYPAPRPVPPFTGQTYITYQPMYPQEFLYEHDKYYSTHHAGGGWTNTHASWYSSNFSTHMRRAFVGPTRGVLPKLPLPY